MTCVCLLPVAQQQTHNEVDEALVGAESVSRIPPRRPNLVGVFVYSGSGADGQLLLNFGCRPGHGYGSGQLIVVRARQANRHVVAEAIPGGSGRPSQLFYEVDR